jgi:ferritin-like metal-binding protein YciE
MASIETPQELFVHKLGAALTMEETILDMLENLQGEASDPQLKRNLQQHHQETQQHVANLQQIFRALGEEPQTQPCPTIDGLEKEGKQMVKQVDDPELVDAVILGGVIETEHHEIAVYDGLIITAEQMDDQDIVALLHENLEQEESTLDKAVKASEQSAKELVSG